MTLIEIATVTQERLDQANALIALRAEELEAIKANHAAEIKAYKAQVSEFNAYKADMEKRVADALQSDDPEQYKALAVDFLTPAQERERLEKLARIALLEAEAVALKSTV